MSCPLLASKICAWRGALPVDTPMTWLPVVLKRPRARPDQLYIGPESKPSARHSSTSLLLLLSSSWSPAAPPVNGDACRCGRVLEAGRVVSAVWARGRHCMLTLSTGVCWTRRVERGHCEPALQQSCWPACIEHTCSRLTGAVCASTMSTVSPLCWAALAVAWRWQQQTQRQHNNSGSSSSDFVSSTIRRPGGACQSLTQAPNTWSPPRVPQVASQPRKAPHTHARTHL